jgi:hypothetical protein
MQADYSTKSISSKLLQEISESLKGLDFGSVELFVSNNEVTQITKRKIKKTNGFRA